MKYRLFIFFLLVGVSCAETDLSRNRIRIARVGEQILYMDDLSKETSSDILDSVELVKQFVDKWTREEVIIQRALLELPDEALNVERQLEDYKKSLIIYAYEKELIKKKLDTLVTDQEIQEYYSENQENFKLQDYIVKVFYLKVSKDAPKLDELRKWYKLKNEDDSENLLSYAPVHSINYYFDEKNWVYFDDVLKVIPLTDINKSSFIRNMRKVTFQEGDFVYFLNIRDYRLKDAVSPLSLEKEKIKSIILNIRANQLKKKIREELYNDAKKKQEIETY